MEIRPAVSRREYERMSTRELREAFVIEKLFTAGAVDLTYWETDRTIVGSVVPLASSLLLETAPELVADFFLQRRELGVINIGGPGSITVDGTKYRMESLDGLYVGRGRQSVSFASDTPTSPAKYYLISYPAHGVYLTTRVTPGEANRLELGDQETANKRTIHQYVHETGTPSCQLVMGMTKLNPGSVWNTMPPHTHSRRSEVYLYFDVPPDSAVFHFMGPQDGTRNLLMHSGQAALSPGWSIHSGCGTRAYSFIWAMGGENQRFADMDGIAIPDLR